VQILGALLLIPPPAKNRRSEDQETCQDRRRRAGEIAALDRALLPELRAVADMPPTLTFVDRLVLQRGDRTIEVRWLGRGNTCGDTVVVLPKERIAASGDLVVHPVPFGILSYYDEWRDTLSKLDVLPVDALFPGHGPLMRDRAFDAFFVRPAVERTWRQLRGEPDS
jgi:glyoxylase-like metal-dependent hydrolase (beta-lactamase superfamily II)